MDEPGLLIEAAMAGDLPEVQWLLDEGECTITDVDDVFGSTALLWAAFKGRLHIVKWLLREGGATITERSFVGNTALHCATLNGFLPIVKWLLKEGGSSILETNDQGATALLLAASNGFMPIVQWLVRQGGASIAQADTDGETALHYACRNGCLTVVQWLLREGGSKIQEKSTAGNTALLCSVNQLPVAHWLLTQGGANINDKNQEGHSVWTLLLPLLTAEGTPVEELMPVLQALLARGPAPDFFARAMPLPLQTLLAQSAVVRTQLPADSMFRAQAAQLLHESKCGMQLAGTSAWDILRGYAWHTEEDLWVLAAQGPVQVDNRKRKR